ncbi:MAG: ATP-binding protein, partial [Gemmatimonadota bacterium]|nr:ATP-binding protein [Gemmatimonadota bacterium]
MAEDQTSFPVGIEFQSVLRAISKQIYETPLAFIRENVQNAVDAIRIQAHREGISPGDAAFRIDVTIENHGIVVKDNGTGMSARELQHYFWTIGASGKRTPEAVAAGCVGMFGIGGFANFGVCDSVEVVSQDIGSERGTRTKLSEADIQASGTGIPRVSFEPSDEAAPRGTIVRGTLREPAAVDELRAYLLDFVRFVPTGVYVNGQKLSQASFTDIDDRPNLTEIREGHQEWHDGDLVVSGRLFEDRGRTLVASIDGLVSGGEPINLTGQIRFENGPIDVFKRGFKLCATQIGTTIGVSGRLDCDLFVPTAGRDSLDAVTTSLLGRIVLALERVAIDAVLETPERIAQNARVFRYVLNRGLIAEVGHAKVNLADGSESMLADIRRRAEGGGVSVFYGLAQKQALNQIMHARGHIVVLLSADGKRREVERRYLEQFCSARAFDGIIDCTEHYAQLSRFEKVFLSEVELNISRSYEVKDFRLIPGKLTEDIPVFVKEIGGNQPPDIFVDVRHQEIAKLESVGYGQILYSLVSTFCREYLGTSLKKWSPRFFGDGALNLELLAKRRSELWILLKHDIGVVRQGGQRQVINRSDVRVVTVGSVEDDPSASAENPQRPRILQIIDERSTTGIEGYYIRLPDGAFAAYGDLLPECDSRGVVWAGNRILYVASDTVSAAFQYEIRVDEVVSADVGGVKRAEGALELDRSLQQLFDGLYFPIPQPLEPFLVPSGEKEIRLELH